MGKSKIDVSKRTVLDSFNNELILGDIIAIADNCTMIIGVYQNHFDNGSGWKIRYRVPHPAYILYSAYRSGGGKPYNPTDIKTDSWGGNSTITNYWEKVGEDETRPCRSVFRITTPLDCDAYRNAEKLRNIMIQKGNVKPSIQEPETPPFVKAEPEKEGSLSSFEDILSNLGAPEIK